MTTPHSSLQGERTIQVGHRTLPTRYFLAPLAGYTQLNFRRVIRELGGCGHATTDLVLATHLVSGTRKSLKLVETTADDKPLTIQIYGGVTEHLLKAAKWLEDRGYEAIDLNMGCPMAKVNGSGGGARLMCQRDDAVRMVEQLVEATDLPVSVKMRLGWDATSITAPELAAAFEQVGIVAVTIHGRTRAQGFHGQVDLEGIQAVVDAVQTIPVVGNGDVRVPEDAIRMRQQTGCDAVAIGRGAMLDPWIFRKLQQLEQGESQASPTAKERLHFLKRHFELMHEQHPERSHLLFRKFTSWYGAIIGIPEQIETKFRQLQGAEHFQELWEQTAERLEECSPRPATALIKTPNGPIDKW